MSRFDDDNAGQKRVRDLVIGPGLYGPFSQDGRYVYIDKGRLATILQKQFAVDTIVQSTNGSAVCIEEKIVRWPGYRYESLTLETKSCTIPGYEADGWMSYGQADILNYAMCQRDGNVEVTLIPFQKLQAAFWPNVDNFKETVTSQHNRTACRVVPLKWISQHVGYWQRLIHATPDGALAVRAYNGNHYKNRNWPDYEQWELGL
jgi:hypothetical protein